MKKNITLILVFTLFTSGVLALNNGNFANKPAYRSWFRASMLYQGEGYAFAVPADWRDVSNTVPGSDVFVVSDGSDTMPVLDGAMQSIRSAIYAETFRGKKQEQILKMYYNEMIEKRGCKRDDIKQDKIKLNDGTDAIMINSRLPVSNGSKIMYTRKIFIQTNNDNSTVISGFIIVSRGNDNYIFNTGSLDFVNNHIMSTVLDANKFDGKGLSQAYKRLPAGLNKSINKCYKYFALMFSEPRRALGVFEKTLKKYNYIFWVSNAAARILLTPKDESLLDLKKGMYYAMLSVEQTQRQDGDALELLAIAQYKNGQKDEALVTIGEAVKLDPNHLRYLETYKAMKAGIFK